MRVALFRKAHFNAAHRLHVAAWTEERNREVFGVCNNPNYHGHNYDLEVKLVGEVDPVTGMLINLKELSKIIKEDIEDRFDHKNLDLDCPEFSERSSTVENICYVIWSILENKLGSRYDITVRLYETARNYAEYPA